MRFSGTLVFGVFVECRNRFVADVTVDGVLALANVPNTGHIPELVVPGCEVLLRPTPDGQTPTRQLPMSLGQSVAAGQVRSA